MTYIEYLNQFHRWRENGNPGDKLIVLYLNMLDMFNQRYWPEWAGVTTQQLMVLANTANKNAALSARDALVKAGFLEYRRGRKGKATTYRLLSFGIESDTENMTETGTENSTENHGADRADNGAEAENGGGFDTESGGQAGNGIKFDTENSTETDTENSTKNSTETRTPNKIKTKTKTKTKNGSERGGADAAASPAIVRHKYGKYKHILLSDEEVRKLGEELGQEETNRCVRYLDEYMEIHGNKCHWKNFYLVALKCSHEKWGIRPGDNFADRNGGTDWEALAREMDEEDARRNML